MFGVEEFLALFEETKVNYIGPNKYFAYSPITNTKSRTECNMYDRLAIVVIYDTRTGYINATRLVPSIAEKNVDKQFAVMRKNVFYKKLIIDIEKELNSRILPDKYKALPCWGQKKAYVAEYEVEIKKGSKEAAGWYIHPDCLIHILVWANRAMATRFNNIIMLILLRQGQNEMYTAKTMENEMVKELREDIIKKREAINELESENKDLILAQRIDKDEIEKLHRYITDLNVQMQQEKFAKRKHKNNSKVPSRYQSLMIVRYYDKVGVYSRGSDYSKIVMTLIDNNEVEDFVQQHSNHLNDLNKRITLDKQIEDGNEVDFFIETDYANSYAPESEIVYKFLKLQGAPLNIMETFMEVASETLDIHFITDNIDFPIMIVDETFDTFIQKLAEYLGPYMIY